MISRPDFFEVCEIGFMVLVGVPMFIIILPFILPSFIIGKIVLKACDYLEAR